MALSFLKLLVCLLSISLVLLLPPICAKDDCNDDAKADAAATKSDKAEAPAGKDGAKSDKAEAPAGKDGAKSGKDEKTSDKAESPSGGKDEKTSDKDASSSGGKDEKTSDKDDEKTAGEKDEKTSDKDASSGGKDEKTSDKDDAAKSDKAASSDKDETKSAPAEKDDGAKAQAGKADAKSDKAEAPTGKADAIAAKEAALIDGKAAATPTGKADAIAAKEAALTGGKAAAGKAAATDVPAGQAGAAGPNYIPGFTGAWELQQENAGVSAMHLNIMPNTNMAIMYDTSVLGPSIINLLPGQMCRKVLDPPGSPDDCTAHAVEYDTNTGKVRPLRIDTDFWCSSGGLTPEGSLISIGGTKEGGRSVRYLDPCPTCEFRDTPDTVAEPRWYASQAQLPDNRYFVIGGRAAFSYEYVGPEGQRNDKAFFSQFMKDTTDKDENNLYPFVHLSTDGNLFIFSNDRSIIFNPLTNAIVRELPVLAGGARCYPASGSSVLMPLRLDTAAAVGGGVAAQIMICGGGPKNTFAEANKGNFLPALDDCNTIDITNPNAAWVREVMPSPRTMGDMLLLPNTEVLLINGAKRGCSAWGLGEDPNLTPVMYGISRPAGQRFMELAPATIARMYHATSALLIDGKILVAGSNTHDRYTFDVKYPTEVRVEKFSPPYLNPALKDSQPQIQPQGTDIKLAYGQPIKVTFTVAAPMTKETTMVTLYAPVFTTHGCSMNQKVLVLAVKDVVKDPAGPYLATATAPAGPQLAPAGYYMLFVNNGVVPSTGVWVHLK